MAETSRSYLLWFEEVLFDAAILVDHLWWTEELPHVLDPLHPFLRF